MITSLNHQQCQLEGALGMLKKAAQVHGDTPKGQLIWKLAFELKALRDPEVVELLDARKHKRLMNAEKAFKAGSGGGA